jgi:hypothetical protein
MLASTRRHSQWTVERTFTAGVVPIGVCGEKPDSAEGGAEIHKLGLFRRGLDTLSSTDRDARRR